MPIAKLISADGPIEIYYELHGRHSTTRDDMSYSKATDASRWAGKRSSSINEAIQKDPALARTLHAVDSAVGAQQAVEKGRQDGQVRRLQHNSSNAIAVPRRSTPSAAGSQIEMADMSGRSSSACQSTGESPAVSEYQASEAGLSRKQSARTDTEEKTPETLPALQSHASEAGSSQQQLSQPNSQATRSSKLSKGSMDETTAAESQPSEAGLSREQADKAPDQDKAVANLSNGASDVKSSKRDAEHDSAVPNGHAVATHVIEMPHEDLETSSSRYTTAVPAPSCCSTHALPVIARRLSSSCRALSMLPGS